MSPYSMASDLISYNASIINRPGQSMAAEMIVFHTMEDPRLLGLHSSGAALLERRVFQEVRHADPWAQVAWRAS